MKSVFDESLDIIETDRLKELALLQTFEVTDTKRYLSFSFCFHLKILETELENIDLYEGFSDCLDKFPL